MVQWHSLTFALIHRSWQFRVIPWVTGSPVQMMLHPPQITSRRPSLTLASDSRGQRHCGSSGVSRMSRSIREYRSSVTPFPRCPSLMKMFLFGSLLPQLREKKQDHCGKRRFMPARPANTLSWLTQTQRPPEEGRLWMKIVKKQFSMPQRASMRSLMYRVQRSRSSPQTELAQLAISMKDDNCCSVRPRPVVFQNCSCWLRARGGRPWLEK